MRIDRNASDKIFERRLRCGLVALLTIAIGLVLRLAQMGLPSGIVKWGGSVLWAAMVYWLLAALWPKRSKVFLVLTGTLIAAAVEFSRLYRTPELEAFRLTLTGKLLLGRVFSIWHLPVYTAALLAAAAADLFLGRSGSPSPIPDASNGL